MSNHEKPTKRERKWQFTLNNYTAEDEKEILSWEPDLCDYVGFGHEVAPETGTPHLQGGVVWKALKSLKVCKKILPKAHWETALDWDKLLVYNMKAGDYVEAGTRPKGQGARSDVTSEDYITVAKDHVDFDEYLLALGPKLARNIHIARSAFTIHQKRVGHTVIVDQRPWQALLTQRLEGGADPRLIDFVVDPELVEAGKSEYARWAFEHLGAATFMGDDEKSVMSLYRGQPICIFCYTFEDTEYNYRLLERVKDGVRWKTKYEVACTYYARPHVVVFCNHMPDLRWCYRTKRARISMVSGTPGKDYIEWLDK